VALHLAAADDDDRLPWPNWLSGDTTNRQGWLYQIDAKVAGPAQFKVVTGGFWPVLGNRRLFFCPSDDTNNAFFLLRGQQISSYVMNGAACGFDRALYPALKLSQLSPAGIAFWECANNTREENEALFNDGASWPGENTSARHGRVAIFGAFDGSARTMPLTEWKTKAGESVRNELWCYPGSNDGR
jgi:hypothetical protein